MNILTSKAFLKGILFTTIFSISGFSADFDAHDKHGAKVRVMVPIGVDQKDSISDHSANAVNNKEVVPANNPLTASKRSWGRTTVGGMVIGLVCLYFLNPFSARSPSKNSSFEMSDSQVPFAITQLSSYSAKSPIPEVWYNSGFSLVNPLTAEHQDSFSFTVPETCPNTIVWSFSESDTVCINPYPSQSAYGDSFTLTPAVRNILEISITDGVNPTPALYFNGTMCPVAALIENSLEERTCKVPTQQKEEVTQPLTVTDLIVTDLVLTKNKSSIPNSNTEASGFFWVKVAGGVVLIVGTVGLDLLRRYNNAVESVNGVINSSWRQWWPTARAHTWWYGNPEVWQEVLSSYSRTLGM